MHPGPTKLADMAEVRKFKPGQSAIAEAVQKAMGESVRPVAPGGSPDPGKPEPTSATVTGQAAATPITATSFLVSEQFLVPADDPAEQSDS